MKKLRLGFIASGMVMTWQHGRNIINVPGVEVVALSDPNGDNIGRLKRRIPQLASCREYDDHRPMLKEEGLDAVIVGSPHTLHYSHIRDALDAGCHVLTEKPFTTTVAHAKVLNRLAKKKRRVLSVSFQRHWDPTYRMMRQIVREGRIGKLQAASSFMAQSWYRSQKGKWRYDPKLSGGGMLNDSASHLLDASLYVLDKVPVEVYALIDKKNGPVDINTGAVVRLRGGAYWTISVSGNSPAVRNPDNDYVIAGDKGVLRLNERGEIWLLEGEVRSRIDRIPAYHHPDTGFIRAIRKQGPNDCSGDFALRTVQLTEALYQSARTRKAVKIH